MKYLQKNAVMLLAALPLAGCASVSGPKVGAISFSALYGMSAPNARLHSTSFAAALSALHFAARAPKLSDDESVGATGVLGQTVNEVVPIPGTDMIRVGALQEGSFFQSSFRSGSEEAALRGGGLTGAVIIFRIFRP